MRKLKTSPSRDALIHEIKAAAVPDCLRDRGENFQHLRKAGDDFDAIREIIVRHGHSFTHELCNECFGNGDHVIDLPAAYRPNVREHDTIRSLCCLTAPPTNRRDAPKESQLGHRRKDALVATSICAWEIIVRNMYSTIMRNVGCW